jgi:hypothetical protein
VARRVAELIGPADSLRHAFFGVVLGISWPLAEEAFSASDVAAAAEIYAERGVPIYPLKASPNKRYLVDQDNVPFMMVGDSPQSLLGRMSKSDAAYYMANRQRHGINTLWVNLLCNNATACNADGTTFTGTPPFTIPRDISTPNPAYFEHAHDMLKIAAAHGMTIMLDVAETAGWLDIFKANGPDKAAEFGRYVGKRYKDVPNIIWMYGNDFQTWADTADDAVVLAVAKGIRSADPNHIHTTELNYLTSGSLDDARWEPLLELDGAYTYYPTYAQVLKEYNRPKFRPVFVVEANYEFEHNANTDGGSLPNLRHQEYWTMLSGATGQLYGSNYTWRLPTGWFSSWRSHLDTPGVMQLRYMKNLFAPRKWYDLVPDQTHTVVTDGYGTPAPFGTGSVATDTYATAARTPNGTLIIAYMPTIRPITVDMSKLSGSAAARWYDPTTGEFIPAADSLFANVGARQFTPPGNNHDGDVDWVLVLEAS